MPNFWTRVQGLFRARNADGELMEPSTDTAVATVENKHGSNLLSRVGDAFTGKTYEKIEAGQQQVLDLIKSIAVHLDTQSQRSERMAGSLAQLAHSLSSMPEANRLQGDTLRALVSHVAAGNSKTETLAALLSELQKNQSVHGRVLENLSVNAQTTQISDRQMAESIRNFSDTMDALGVNARQQTNMISRLSEVEEKQDARLIELIRKQNRRFNSLFVVTLTVAGLSVLGALATALIVLWR